MSRPLFTPEELEELARIDAELEAAPVTADELADSRRRDRAAKLDSMDKRTRRIAEQRRQYYEAHREEIAEHQRQCYKAFYYADRPSQDGIRARRKALRVSQAELAHRVGVSPSLICMIEKGRCGVVPQTMRMIEETLEEMEGAMT